MVEETLKAIKNIRYPHESYLCDDAGDPRMEELCRKLDVHYVTRDNRKDAKAGNINNALKQASGEIAVILDPDHVPQPDFLDRVLPHFNDPGIGFVQVVQAYKNKHESLVAKGAAQQTFQFYGPMMMTMNRYGTVQAIGANCTFRRAALDSIGGHAPGLAEDMHTAMQLHARGWRSVYEPAIVARGLVPSTLSGYYKQQLKWARGTTELLVSTYPKLFKGLTFRQRLHYGSIPFHYFSGFVFLLNFLIPILALVFNLIPLKVDMLQLGLVATPFLATSLLIRHFVQRWVMEESERGFHVVGGFLHIGTWWINILGVLFTLMRVEVPYDPTPKDGQEGNTLRLNLPNILIGILSLVAVVYGLSLDWSPFSLVMALLALFNAGFMTFMVIAGLQPKIREFQKRQQMFDGALAQVRKAQKSVWVFRHAVYAGFRRAGLPMSILITVACMFLYKFSPGPRAVDHFREHAFYTGIYHPYNEKPGFTDLDEVTDITKTQNLDFGIVSLYLPWRVGSRDTLPFSYLQDVYQSGAIPLITWEPWLNEMKKSNDEHRGTFRIVADGEIDGYLQEMASQFKDLGKPVYLRFAHEPDNPQYPWSENGDLRPEDFISAWKHCYRIFKEAGAENVIWVWNPWHAESLKEFFPGEDYVDWIGLTLLNYAEMNRGEKWLSFEQLYAAYDSTGIFDYQIPVMLSEFGSLKRDGRQDNWYQKAFEEIKTNHPEIRALVFFHEADDHNVPPHDKTGLNSLDWSIEKPASVFAGFNEEFVIHSSGAVRALPEPSVYPYSGFEVPGMPADIKRGINFHKGKDWRGNYDELSMRTARSDFSGVKNLGAEVVKWYGPGIYDRNALQAAADQDLKMVFSFWIPDHIDYQRDFDRLAELEARILKTVKKHHDEPQIVAWNLGNGTWQGLARTYAKPELFYQKEAYLSWMNKITGRIRELDPQRPVTLDVDLNAKFHDQLMELSSQLPMVSAYGVRVEERDSNLIPLLENVEVSYFVSAVSVHMLKDLSPGLCFIEHYKDQRTSNYASLSGLLDINGRFKQDYFFLRSNWTGEQAAEVPPELRIITPARPVYAYQKLRYNVAARNEEGMWLLAKNAGIKDLRYSWYLVKTDRYGNYLKVEGKGNGPECSILIPENYENYRVYLIAQSGNRSWNVMSKLNRPFEIPPLAVK